MTNTTTEASTGVIVAMATFNGEAWLPQQIASIREQTFTDFTFLVSDDGSNDETVDIIRQAAKEDHRIQLLPYRNGVPGHVANFEYLLESALWLGCETVFLADQDDLWLPDKLELMLQLCEESGNVPMAAFSDLEVIDSQDKPLGSYLHSIGMYGNYDALSLLRQNPLAGCSMMVNRALLELAMPFPPQLQNHDWWLGLCAQVSGRLSFSSKRLVRYRQHSGNTIGSRNFTMQSLRLGSILQRQRRVFESKVSAVDVLLERMDGREAPIPDDLWDFAKEFRGCLGWRRPRQLLFSKFRPPSKALCLVQLLALSPILREH